MQSFLLSTDSCCDLFKSELADLGVRCINLCYTAVEEGRPVLYEDNFQCYEEYVDFFRRMKEGFQPKTTQLSVEQLAAYFESIREGDTPIVHVSLSSGLSGTCGCAEQAAALVRERTGTEVLVLDSLSATIIQKLIVLRLARLRDEGVAPAAACEAVRGYLQRLQSWLLITDLEYLKRGGRISGAKAAVGNLLKLRPILVVNKFGKLAIHSKAKGTKKGIAEIVEKIKEYHCDFSHPMHIVHTDAAELAEELRAAVQAAYPQADLHIDIMGPIIGSHFGPGSTAIVFAGDERLDIE